MNKEIEIKVGTAKTKEGKEFTHYKALQKDGRYMDARFRNEVKNLPTENSIIVVDENDISLDYNRKYPRVWFHKVLEVKPIAPKTINEDDLPF